RLILLDVIGSPTTKEFIEFCDSVNVKPFVMIPHNTHVCQHLDIVDFQLYKHNHDIPISTRWSF
ncbi:hypothetical protein EX30DRAFT_311870, partial [Ascodesmis nigricans]